MSELSRDLRYLTVGLCSQVAPCLLPDRWKHGRDDCSNADQSMYLRYRTLVKRGTREKCQALSSCHRKLQPRHALCRLYWATFGVQDPCRPTSTSNLHPSSPVSIPRRDLDGPDFRADVAFAETTAFAQTLLELLPTVRSPSLVTTRDTEHPVKTSVRHSCESLLFEACSKRRMCLA